MDGTKLNFMSVENQSAAVENQSAATENAAVANAVQLTPEQIAMQELDAQIQELNRKRAEMERSQRLNAKTSIVTSFAEFMYQAGLDGVAVDENNEQFIKLRQAVYNEIPLLAQPKTAVTVAAAGTPTVAAAANGNDPLLGLKGDTNREIVTKYLRYKQELNEPINVFTSDSDVKKRIVAEGNATGTTGAAILAFQRLAGVK